MPDPTLSKRCTRCKGTFPVSEFYRNTRTGDGWGIYCRECVRRMGREGDARRRRARFDALVPLTYKGAGFVKLTKGWAKVSVGDWPMLFGWGSFHPVYAKDRTYAAAKRRLWAVPRGEKNRQQFLHCILLGTDREIDHADRDGLNNTRENLRYCTRTQNNANRRRQSNATSTRFKGIYPNSKAKGRWCAQIGIDGKRKYLGIFATEEEAARAYDAAAKELFGEFARTNFP